MGRNKNTDIEVTYKTKRNGELVEETAVVSVTDELVALAQKAIAFLREGQTITKGPNAGKPMVGIHSVYTSKNGLNFNTVMQRKGLKPQAATSALAQVGALESHPAKGGAMLYLPGEMPTSRGISDEKADELIAAIEASS